MLLEKMFGNTFGLIWLIVLLVVVLGLIVFLFVKNENGNKKTIENLEVEDNKVEETSNNKEEVEESSVEEVVVEQVEEEVKVDSEYEIIEGEDGFFRVRKVGSERTLRKLATKEEAEEFVKQKENK